MKKVELKVFYSNKTLVSVKKNAISDLNNMFNWEISFKKNTHIMEHALILEKLSILLGMFKLPI